MKYRLALFMAFVAFTVGYADATTPASEREALIALYNSTNGAGWSDREGWRNAEDTDFAAPGTECSWYGVECIYYNSMWRVWHLKLDSNQLSGSIPPEIGNLTFLSVLKLNSNQLSGPIPPEIGILTSLIYLHLDSNQLNGSIPPEIGNLANLSYLYLHNNQLSGSIPPQIGNIGWSLHYLYLQSNQLSGSIPPEIENLVKLNNLHLQSNQLSGPVPPEIARIPYLQSLNLGYNALWTGGAALRTYLTSKDPDWEHTQTIAPENLIVTSVHDRTIWLEWTPILYTADSGGYEVLSEEVVTKRAAVSGGLSASKTDSTFPVTDLQPEQSYNFTVQTVTRPHAFNGNTVISEQCTPPVMATTSSTGCTAPVVTRTDNGPFTLSVTSSHDSCEWSTGETTSSITVLPPHDTWYWVNVTLGSCEEAAVVFTPGGGIFFDGFESGDFSRWSSHLDQ